MRKKHQANEGIVGNKMKGIHLHEYFAEHIDFEAFFPLKTENNY